MTKKTLLVLKIEPSTEEEISEDLRFEVRTYDIEIMECEKTE